jgi:hypothetical protein
MSPLIDRQLPWIPVSVSESHCSEAPLATYHPTWSSSKCPLSLDCEPMVHIFDEFSGFCGETYEHDLTEYESD